MRRIGASVVMAGVVMVGGVLAAQETRPEGVERQAYRWRNVEIGGGGFVTGIVMHPSKKGLMYARTDIGGAYRWEGDGNGAGRWIAMMDWVTRKDWNLWGVESVAVDPNDATRVYLACGTYTRPFVGNGVILRSGDGGRSFERAGIPLKMGGNEDGRFAGERLAVDGAKGSILLFGSRNDGLWRSEDWGATWKKVESFPVGGRTNGVGIVFVLFDSSQIPAGEATRTIYVGVSGSGTSAEQAGLYRSMDGGASWDKVKGQPEGSLMPSHAAMATNGMMYVTYGDAPGPNGMNDGAVWRYNMTTGEWGDVTPARPGGNAHFGYGGVAVDARNPGVVMATTMDRWGTGDDAYRSTDGGAHWKAVAKAGARDPGVSPWITMGRPQADAGHWMGDIEIDPFNSDHVMYTTGATIWESWDVTAADKGERTHWRVGAAGLEETVVLDLVSPPTGPRLISGVGDVSGFVHEDLYVSPGEGRMEPAFTNTESIDFGGQAPDVIARVGTVRNGGGSHGAYSMDGGKRWKSFVAEPGNSAGGGTVAVSADGKVLVWGARNAVVSWSNDNGASWEPSKGLGNAARGRPVADKVEAGVFYVAESATGKVLVSRDGGKSFAAAGGTVNPSGGGLLRVGPSAAGDLWFGGKNGLEHSTDGGKTFVTVSGVEETGGVGFGKGKEGAAGPAIYLAGKVKGIEGIFRSDDGGKGWVEISDPQHEYSNSSHITGDMRMYGRVYVGTPGRGVVFGDIDTDPGAGMGR